MREFTPDEVSRRAGILGSLATAASLVMSGDGLGDRQRKEVVAMDLLAALEILAGELEAATNADMLHWRRQEASAASAAASRMQPDRVPTMGFVPKPPAGPPAAAS